MARPPDPSPAPRWRIGFARPRRVVPEKRGPRSRRGIQCDCGSAITRRSSRRIDAARAGHGAGIGTGKNAKHLGTPREPLEIPDSTNHSGSVPESSRSWIDIALTEFDCRTGQGPAAAGNRHRRGETMREAQSVGGRRGTDDSGVAIPSSRDRGEIRDGPTPSAEKHGRLRRVMAEFEKSSGQSIAPMLGSTRQVGQLGRSRGGSPRVSTDRASFVGSNPDSAEVHRP